MPVSADYLQFAIVQETTYGVTPANPVFQVLPVTDESVAANAETTTSNALNPNAQVLDSYLNNLISAGVFNVEFSLNPASKILLDSAMSRAAVDADGLGTGSPLPPQGAPNVAPKASILGTTENGGAKISFTLEKRFPDPVNAGQYLYQRFAGCVIDVLTMNLAPTEPVTFSFTVLGAQPTTGTAILTGATYVQPGNQDVFRGPDVLKVLDLMTGITTALPCMTTMTCTLTNNYRGQQCIGDLGNVDVIQGQREPTAAAQIYYTSNDIIDALIAQTEFAYQWEMKANGGDYFALLFPRCKITQDPVVAGGTNTDVVDDMALQGLYDATAETAMTIWYEEV